MKIAGALATLFSGHGTQTEIAARLTTHGLKTDQTMVSAWLRGRVPDPGKLNEIMEQTYGFRWAPDAFIVPDTRDRTGRKVRRPGWITLMWARHATPLEPGASRRRQLHPNPVMRFHDLRHWYATYLLDQGVPLATVSKLLGHSKVTTTLGVYTHAVDESDHLAAATIARALPTALPSTPAHPQPAKHTRNVGD